LQVSVVGRLRAEDFYKEKAGTDDDAAVGHVEVGPVVAANVDFKEVDNVAEADAVVEVADGSPEDEREGYGAESDRAGYSPEHADENDGGDYGEGDEDVAHRGWRGGFGEHAKGGAGVVDIGDAKDAGDDGVGLAVGKLLGDDAFGDAVDDDDCCCDGERDAALIAWFGRDGWRCGFVGRLVR